MKSNKKAAQVAGTRTAKNTAVDSPYPTIKDPLQGWHDLAKPSRERQQKQSWKRGKKAGQGFVDDRLLLPLVLLVLVALVEVLL